MADGVTFKRILKWGFINFFRNGVVSVATVLVMSLSILMIGSVIIASSFASALISKLEAKVDINAEFKDGASASAISDLKSELEKLPEIKSVRYVPSEDALAEFKERHKDDPVIIGSLDVVVDNPFHASIEISAKDPSKYDAISRFLEDGKYADIIRLDDDGNKVITYREHRETIDWFTSLIATAKKTGFIVSLALAAIALMVAYSTVRLAIYNAKDEISVMQLVGASRAFIRGPFLVEGVIHGILSALFALAVFYPAFWFAGEKTASFFMGLNIFEYFIANIWQIGGILLLIGMVLGSFSAALAVRKYLKV